MKLRPSYQNLLTLLLTGLALLSCPVIIILIPILTTTRVVVRWLSKIFKSHLHDGGMVEIMAGNLVSPEFNEMFLTGTRSALYATAIIDADLDTEELRRQVLDRMVNRKRPKISENLQNENLVEKEPTEITNPQLRQTVRSWLGYNFWHSVRDFKIENYVREQTQSKNGAIIFENDMPKILKEVINKPFTFGQSPWEILVWKNARLRNANDDNEKIKTILLFRFHHCLGDGYGLFHLLLDGLANINADGDSDEDGSSIKFLKKRVLPQAHNFENIFLVTKNLVWTFLKSPYELVHGFVQAWDSSHKVLLKRREKSMDKFNIAWSELIALDEIFEIKQIHQCTFHTVLYAAFTGGIRHFFLHHGLQLPEKIHSFEPVPLAGPSYTSLGIRTSVALGQLPVSLSCPSDRVKSIHDSLKQRESPACPHFLFYGYQILGRLPAIVRKFVGANHFTASLFFYHVVPKLRGKIQFLDRRLQVDDVCCGSGPLPGNVGIVMAAQSYNGFVRLSVSVDDTILKEPAQVEELMQNIRDELQLLRKQKLEPKGC